MPDFLSLKERIPFDGELQTLFIDFVGGISQRANRKEDAIGAQVFTVGGGCLRYSR